MKRCLTPIVVVILILTSGLVVGCSSDGQVVSQKSYEQVVFQKVDSLQVESFLRQQDINDKISAYQHKPESSFSSAYVPYTCVPEWQNQVEFLRQQYQQLQGIKYELKPEELDNLMADSLVEQERLKTAIETQQVYLSDAQREEELSPGTFPARQVDIEVKKLRIGVMSEQLEFLMEQYQELEELRDFVLLSD